VPRRHCFPVFPLWTMAAEPSLHFGALEPSPSIQLLRMRTSLPPMSSQRRPRTPFSFGLSAALPMPQKGSLGGYRIPANCGKDAICRLTSSLFIALINAPGRFLDRKMLRLSDAFMDVPGFDETRLELEVMVYNINEGQNPEILARCATLKEYAYFVACARWHIETEKRRQGTTSEGKVIRAAIRQAVLDCKAKGYLLDYWGKMQ